MSRSAGSSARAISLRWSFNSFGLVIPPDLRGSVLNRWIVRPAGVDDLVAASITHPAAAVVPAALAAAEESGASGERVLLAIVAGYDWDGGVPFFGRLLVRRSHRLVLARLVDLYRRAVEFRVGKLVGRFPEVHQGEIILLRVLVDAGAAADDLLEFRH